MWCVFSFILLKVKLALEQQAYELCRSTYTKIFFSIVNTTALHTPRLVESADGEPQYRGSTAMLLVNFQLHIGLEPLIHVVQGLTVIHLRVISIQTIQIKQFNSYIFKKNKKLVPQGG